MSENRSDQVDPQIRRLVDAARGLWIRRLIDPSRANSLLFYRDLKLGTLDLSEETDVVSRLLAGEKLTAESLGSLGRVSHSSGLSGQEQDKFAVQQNYRKTLVALQRKALGNLEEKGIETLHLAMGMATWPATDGGRPYDAPVLLLPAAIEPRARASDDLRLEVAGEPQINPVLLYSLEENFGVRLKASEILSDCGTEDESGRWRVAEEMIFARIEDAASKLVGFKLKRRVILANFQFAKMAMVEDLKRNGDSRLERNRCGGCGS